MRQRGVFEKVPGSGVWWVHYYDGDGKRRREKAGTKANAIALYYKRKAEALAGRKLPERLRQRPLLFREIADDALAYSRAHKRSHRDDEYRMRRLPEWFGDKKAAEITPQEIERRLEEMSAECTPGTHIPVNSKAEAALRTLFTRANGLPYVCPGRDGERDRDWERWFERCVQAAGVPDFRWHDLRHTFASRLVMAGVDLRTVQELLGHKSILMTMRYAHLAPAHLRDAIERLAGERTATRTATGPARLSTQEPAYVN